MSERLGSSDAADVLLVEDNPGDVRLTQEAFGEGRVDSTLHVVTDGVEALDFLYRRGEHADAPRPDVVLLDLNLPRKNGGEVLSEINDDAGLSRVPVVILTSSEAEEDVVKSYERHASAYLTKPVDPEEFLEVVRAFKAFWLSAVRLPSGDRA